MLVFIVLLHYLVLPVEVTKICHRQDIVIMFMHRRIIQELFRRTLSFDLQRLINQHLDFCQVYLSNQMFYEQIVFIQKNS